MTLDTTASHAPDAPDRLDAIRPPDARVGENSRILAALAYLLFPVGWLFGFFMQRDDFVRFHARQSLGLLFATVIAPVVWAVVAWGLALIPIVGPLVAAALFAVVIAVWLAVVGVAVWGMVDALRGKWAVAPVFGR